MPDFSELTKIELDAENQRVFIYRVDATGAPITNYPTCSIDLDDLLAASTSTREAKFRWLYFQDANDSCNPKKMLVLATAPEDDV